MISQPIPERIETYLKNRGISSEVIKKNSLFWNGNEIVIPIEDKNGKTLFNKYRRDPEKDLGPKYKYDLGSTAELYNVRSINESDTVFITEGEFDALVLYSQGLSAVSSTGGSGTFKEEWVNLFVNKNVFICYDNDNAGIKGALNVQRLLPHSKIIWLPEAENFSGKDITDFFQKWGMREWKIFVENAESYPTPPLYIEEPSTKKDFDKLISTYQSIADQFLDIQRDLKNQKLEYHFTEVALSIYEKEINDLKNRKKYLDRPKVSGDRLQRAKSVPIPQYLTLNGAGFANCKWHDESTGSLKYYPETNHLYCFGGCGHKDVIDLVMKLKGVDFETALNSLVGN